MIQWARRLNSRRHFRSLVNRTVTDSVYESGADAGRMSELAVEY